VYNDIEEVRFLNEKVFKYFRSFGLNNFENTIISNIEVKNETII